MPAAPHRTAPDDTAVDRLVGAVLRGGVLAAATVTAAGGAMYLASHGADVRTDYAVFSGQPAGLRTVAGIFHGAASLRAEWIIAAGLLLLIATPITRVAVLLVVFLRERDRLYVAVSAIVLAVLLMSFFGGGV